MLALSTGDAHALNIVLTNDDGFETENIQALFRALEKAGHDVILSALYSGQSGTSGQIAFLRPIPPTAAASPGGTLPAGSSGVGETGIAEDQYRVDGSPAASVPYGIDVQAAQHWGGPPDLVICGPNEGNIPGIVTPHSGNIGAAVTALNKGIAAIAVSADGDDAASAEIVADLVIELVEAPESRRGVRLPFGVGLNVNVPPIDPATQTAEDFRFVFTRIGKSANFGLKFYERLGESPVAVGFGIPPGTTLPGVSIEIPASAAGYPEDNSPRSETHALQQSLVTLSVIEGTYAVSPVLQEATRAKLRPELQGRLGNP